jgi:hypothetical protein
MDSRLSTDVHELSTGDLVLCWGAVEILRTRAVQKGDRAMAAEFSARLRLLDAELADRQLTLEQEMRPEQFGDGPSPEGPS